MAGVPYGMIIGGAMDTIGTAMLASGADKRRQQAIDLANTPGIDFGALTGGALSGYNQNYGGALGLASKLSSDQQSLLNAQEEKALPGIAAARQNALGRINGLFANDSAWLQGVQRRGAALGLSSGLFGSSAGQLQTLHLSDQEQMARTQLGTGLLGSLVGSMRLANTPGIQSFLGPSISQQLATRSNEREQRLQMLNAAYGMPTQSEMWAQRLQQVGTTLAGASSGSSPLSSNYGGALNSLGSMGGGGGGYGQPGNIGGAGANMFGGGFD